MWTNSGWAVKLHVARTLTGLCGAPADPDGWGQPHGQARRGRVDDRDLPHVLLPRGAAQPETAFPGLCGCSSKSQEAPPNALFKFCQRLSPHTLSAQTDPFKQLIQTNSAWALAAPGGPENTDGACAQATPTQPWRGGHTGTPLHSAARPTTHSPHPPSVRGNRTVSRAPGTPADSRCWAASGARDASRTAPPKCLEGRGQRPKAQNFWGGGASDLQHSRLFYVLLNVPSSVLPAVVRGRAASLH